MCKSALGKSDWRPAWEREDRNPFIRHESGGHNPFGGEHHLWGNTPAVDILCLEKNEGIAYDQDIYLLFAGEYAPS